MLDHFKRDHRIELARAELGRVVVDAELRERQAGRRVCGVRDSFDARVASGRRESFLCKPPAKRAIPATEIEDALRFKLAAEREDRIPKIRRCVLRFVGPEMISAENVGVHYGAT